MDQITKNTLNKADVNTWLLSQSHIYVRFASEFECFFGNSRYNNKHVASCFCFVYFFLLCVYFSICKLHLLVLRETHFAYLYLRFNILRETWVEYFILSRCHANPWDRIVYPSYSLRIFISFGWCIWYISVKWI